MYHDVYARPCYEGDEDGELTATLRRLGISYEE